MKRLAARRLGFALVSAVVIAAFLMTAVVGVSTILVSQLRSQSQQALSRKALYYAEAALQECFSAACDTGDTTGIRAALVGGDKGNNPPPQSYPVLWTCTRSGDSGSVLNSIAPGDKQSFTVVQAKPVTQGYQFIAMAVICDRDISGLTATELQSGSKYTVLARRIVQMGATGLSVPGGTSAFNYGMFAGSGVIQNGSSGYAAPYSTALDPLLIYAGATVDMHTTAFTGFVDVAAHSTVDVNKTTNSGTIPGTNTTLAPHSAQLTLPSIDLAYWQSQFKAFLTGGPPYDGDTATKLDASGNTYTDADTYMDTKHNGVADLVANYIPATQLVTAPDPTGTYDFSTFQYATPSEVVQLWSDLSSHSGSFASLYADETDHLTWQQLVKTFAHTVFYVQDSATSLDETIAADKQAPCPQYNGVLVCPGTLYSNCNEAPQYSTAGVFLCNEGITFDGSGTYQGTFYTTKGFRQNGSTKGFYGSIIAGTGNIDLNGSADVTLVNYAAGNLQLEGSFKVGVAAQSSWAEVDLPAWTAF